MSPRSRQPLGPIADVLETYLSEGAFFHDQRLAELSALDGVWEAAATHEDRLERQMEGLCVGGETSFELFGNRLLSEDQPGEAFVAALLALRLPTLAPKEALEDALAGPAPQRAALIDALRFAAGEDQEKWLAHYLSAAAVDVRTAALPACVLQPALRPAVTRQVADSEPLVALEARRTLAAMGVSGLPPAALERHLTAAHPHQVILALELLLRADREAAAAACPSLATHADGAVVAASLACLAIAGGRGAGGQIRKVAETRPGLAAAGWVALGLTGESGAMAAMCDRLDGPWQLPEQHAELMALCGGALLLSGELILPRFDPFDFQPEELEPFRQEARAAWQAFAARASASQRWRRGEPFSRAALVGDLAGPGHPRRDLCKLQLDVLFDCRLPFDDRAPIGRQQAAIAALQAWAQLRNGG